MYRGVCTESAAKEAFAGAGDVGEAGEGWVPWGTDSFQTWGPGLRFASVPLAGEERVRSNAARDLWCAPRSRVLDRPLGTASCA